MLRNWSILVAAMALVVGGCSSVDMPKGSSKGFKTVRFQVDGAKPLPSYARIEADVNGMIQRSISDLFETHGLSFTTADGTSDLVVAYLMIMQNAVTTVAVEDYFGYGRDADAVIEAAHQRWVVKGGPSEPLEAGTLVVDVLRSGTNQLIYRGYAHGGINRDISVEEREKRIAAAVDEALQPFFK